MTHLTELQIQEFTDGTADYLTQATCTKHLAICSACRQEVEFQKALVRSARRMSQPGTSRSFARKVMNVVHPTKAGAVRQWVVNNLGSMAAMGAVLGVTSATLLSDSPTESLPFLKELKGVSVDLSPLEQGWTSASGFLSGILSKIPVLEGTGGVLAMSFAVLALLFVVDRVVGRRVVSGNSRRA